MKLKYSILNGEIVLVSKSNPVLQFFGKIVKITLKNESIIF